MGKLNQEVIIMGEKHPDRTNEWSKQQQALKNMKTNPILSKDSKEEKKSHQ